MDKKKILVIEDEEDISTLICYNLFKKGYDVIEAISAEDGLRNVVNDTPDLIILDLMLPGMDGIEFCKSIKSSIKARHIPIIMVTAKGSDKDIVNGLEAGADDYIVKPFSPKILLARVKVIFRRMNFESNSKNDILEVDGLRMDYLRFKVLIDGKEINLTKTEFGILFFLIKNAGFVYTRYQIVDNVKGDDYIVTDRAIDVTIVGLRKKIGEYAKYIETVRGIGYRFKDIG